MSFCKCCTPKTALVICDGGMYTCPETGVVDGPVLSLSYNDSYVLKSPSAYSRVYHFAERLRNILALDRVVEQAVLEEIHAETVRRGHSNVGELSSRSFNEVCRHIGRANIIESRVQIISRLMKWRVRIPTLVVQVIADFKRVNHVFFKVTDRMPVAYRKNFLSYYFLCYKLVHKNTPDLKTFSALRWCFGPLYRTLERLRVAERIWREICQELGWLYVSCCLCFDQLQNRPVHSLRDSTCLAISGCWSCGGY
jgi:hypothetical protein